MAINKTVVLLVVPPATPFLLFADNPITMNTADNFAVLAGTTVTNTGSTSVHGGDVGTSHGKTITGFPPGKIRPPNIARKADPASRQAHSDLTTAYKAAAAMTSTHDLSGQDLGGLTLLPGVYSFSSAATLNGTLTLNNQGNPRTQFVFQIGTTLTTGSDSAVVTINVSSGAAAKSAVTWQVGSSATLGAESSFEGNILASADITLHADASIIDGSALTQYGKVILDSNKITKRVLPIS